jgi:HEAT repeat protein
VKGLRAEGKGWPQAILRGISGDGDAADELLPLLDDADVAIRRKAAEILFELRRPETAQSLRLALGRDEDVEVRRWAALALTRLDQGAPLVFELERSDDLRWKRLASLALAESGDKRGEAALVAWWKDAGSRDHARSRELLEALAKVRSKDAVWPLIQSLDDVRLRPFIAQALARIGDEAARVPLARALATERYQGARVAIAQALVELGAEAEMAEPLLRFLGVPDPLPGGPRARPARGHPPERRRPGAARGRAAHQAEPARCAARAGGAARGQRARGAGPAPGGGRRARWPGAHRSPAREHQVRPQRFTDKGPKTATNSP